MSDATLHAPNCALNPYATATSYVDTHSELCDCGAVRSAAAPVPDFDTELLKYAKTCHLAPGQRVRSRRHPELTGRVKCFEWNAPGVLSAIPYNVEWDDNDRAFEALGMFWIYASDETIEAHDG